MYIYNPAAACEQMEPKYLMWCGKKLMVFHIRNGVLENTVFQKLDLPSSGRRHLRC
jgi:hypothetical protein